MLQYNHMIRISGFKKFTNDLILAEKSDKNLSVKLKIY